MGLTVREALVRGDFDEVAEVLAPDVVWVGVSPGQLCRSREDVLSRFRAALEAGVRARPEILDEVDGMFVVDPHVEPLPQLNPRLHQVLVVQDERIVELRDYPDRASALEAVGRA